ncbi:hypothetical protein ACQP10_01175 [Streptosporangium sandarakinum]|uniref:hypothetical protein n=1 Tax=Streptosporangium sandarakinum TaxID=1260955 RepID=UPI003D8C1853
MITRTLTECISGEGVSVARLWISWNDGRRESFKDINLLFERLSNSAVQHIFSIRVEVTSKKGAISGVLVARREMPGMTLAITGKDNARVLGVNELVFREMMVGYVDRLGRLRAPFLMLMSIAPMFLLSVFTRDADKGSWASIVIFAATAVCSLSIFVLGYRFIIVSNPLVLSHELPPRNDRLLISWISETYRKPAIKAIAGVLGVILVGIVTNKISDFINWP